MKKTDHINLACFWLERINEDVPIYCRLAFIYGSIEPDINFLTYLHGFKKHKKIHGHNFEYILPILLHMIDKCRKDSRSPLLKYYNLGKCLHYTADIFTYPHNEAFVGNISEHLKYEAVLHEHMLQYTNENGAALSEAFFEQGRAAAAKSGDAKKTILKMHKKYLSETPSYETDCKYIINSTGFLTSVILSLSREWTYDLIFA